MSTYRHTPSGLVRNTRYRVDTASGSVTPAAILSPNDGTGIAGSIITSNLLGAGAEFNGAAATLYLKELGYADIPSGVYVTSVGHLLADQLPPTSSAAVSQAALDAALAALPATFAQLVEVDARTYGVVANGATDSASLAANTAALQAFVTAVLTTKKSGVMPVGTIHINGTIDFTSVPAWRIRGAGRIVTTIMQHTDNIPILNLGSDSASFMHTWSLKDFTLSYTNNQPSTNTLANPILFSTMAFNGELLNISFDRGCYAIRIGAGVGGPWGCTWDDLMFGTGLTGGAMDWTTAVNGCPNNHWGRFTVSCGTMVGPVFKALRGYNWRIDTIEFLSANLGPALMEFTAGAAVSIGTLKIEVATWSANRTLFFFSNNNYATIDQIVVAGEPTVNALPAGQAVVIVATGGSTPNGGFVRIGSISAGNFSSVTGLGAAYILGAGSGAPITVDAVNYGSDWALTNIAGTSAADFVTISNYANNRLSQNRGDADYAVTLSDPSINTFSTAFTAPRTISLPSSNADLFSGLYYEFVFNGAINGTNTATITCGGTTLLTQTTDGQIVRFTYRRHPSNAWQGWVMTKTEPMVDGSLLNALIFGS